MRLNFFTFHRPVCLFTCLLIVVTSCSNPAKGQEGFWLHPAKSTNRISENASRDIVQDRQGFLWIATIDGLNRYDGYRFQTYRFDPSDSTSISDNYVSRLHIDRNGNFWVGTFNGLNRYDLSCDCFTNYLEEYKRNGSPGTIVTDILEDSEGRIWVSSYNGLSYLPVGSKNFVPIPTSSGGLREAEVTALAAASGGGIWMGYDNYGISHYNQGNWQQINSDSIQKITGIFELSPSELLVTSRSGFFLVNPLTGKIALIRPGQFAGINCIKNRIIVRSYFYGAFEWLADKKKLVPVNSYFQGKKVNGDLHLYLEDEKGTVWGTYQGLVKQDVFEQRFFNFSAESVVSTPALPGLEVTGISGDSTGRLVISTQYGGISVSQEPCGPWYLQATALPAFEHIVLTDLIYLNGDNAWVTDINALLKYDLSTDKLTRYPSGKATKKILEDKKGRGWLMNLDFGVGRFSQPDKIDKIYSDFGNRKPSAITEDHSGKLWVLADEDLYLYSGNEDRFKYVTALTSNEYRDRTHRQLIVDIHNNVWVGTNDGLFRYRIDTKSHHLYTKGSGLANSKVSSILEAEEGIWVSTNEGLSYFDFATEKFHNYDTADGLINTIYLPGSAYKSPSGWMYFGGINGIDYFHPDSLPGLDTYQPRALLSEILPLNATAGDPEEIRFPETCPDSPLQISYRSLPLQFDMIALDFTQADENKYAFLMEGVDDQWNYSGTTRTTIYSNLPRGKNLTFRIKVVTHDGVWSEIKDYHLYINPPFWQTDWFRLLLAFVVAMGIIAGYRYRIRQIRLRNQFLEKEVKEKTKEIAQQAENLANANTNLRQQAAEIKKKASQLNQLNVAQSGLFTNLSHEFRTLLTLMLGYLDELIVAEDPSLALPIVLNRMRLNAGEMLRLVDQLMDTARVESGRYPLMVSHGDMREECRNVVNSFRVLANQRELELELKVKGDFPELVWFDRDIFYKLLSNLLSNALKFTPAGGKVKVELSLPKDRIMIRVIDTGVGIPTEDLPKIFERFHQLRQADGNFNGTGIGLALVRKLLERHRGEISVESSSDVGTSFSIYLPARSDVYTLEELLPAQSLSKESVPLAPLLPRHIELPVVPARKETSPNVEHQILLIEDNPETRSLIVRQLKREYEVLEAEDGYAGLEIALEEIPDLIISDRLMPNMNGLEFCRAIRADNRTSHIPIIMLTAMSTELQRLEGLQSGADIYLSKPFNRQELGLVVHNQITARDRMRRQFIQSIALNHVPDQLNPTDRLFLQELNAYVSEHLESDIDLVHLTRFLGVSRTQLFRKMKALLGMSVTEFVRDYRLRKAFELIQESKLRVGEIIQATGFNSRSYFYRSFREKFGCSPSEMKNISQSED